MKTSVGNARRTDSFEARHLDTPAPLAGIWPYLTFLLIAVIWASNFLLMKRAALAHGPIGIAAWRCLGAALVMLVMLPFARPARAIDWSGFWKIFWVVGVIGTAIPYVILAYLVNRHGSGYIGMVVGFVPIATIAISALLLKTTPTVRQIIGVVGGLVCLGLLLMEGARRSAPPSDLLLAATVPTSFAFANTYIRKRFSDVSPVALTGIALGQAGFVLLPLLFFIPGEAVRVNDDFLRATGALAALSFIGTGVASFLFFKLVQEQGPLFAGMVTYLVPTGALAWGWLDQEHVAVIQVIALAGMLSMVAIVQTGAATVRSKSHTQKSADSDATN